MRLEEFGLEEEEDEVELLEIWEEECDVAETAFDDEAEGVSLASEALLPCERIESMLPDGEGVDRDEGVEVFQLGRCGEGL